MKTFLLGWLVGWSLAPGPVGAAEVEWLTDLPGAEARAEAEKKMVFVYFTGSDWCAQCIKFDQEVAVTPEFSRFAETNLVLVKLDFPNKKPQDAGLRTANEALKKRFKVEGFPALILLGRDGREIWRQETYTRGGPKPLLRKLESLRKKS
jgi:protein disulfide-isomerase